MVQMPVSPDRDWVIYTGKAGYESYKHMILDFSEQNKIWDEDVARCMLFIHIREGGILRIRKEDEKYVISMDGRAIKCDFQNEGMIKNIIEPLISELHAKVVATLDNSSDMSTTWYNQLPGVTKIKIYMRRFSSSIHYTMQHKMGRNGGKNYHTTGWLKLNTDEPRKTSDKA